MYLLDNQSNLRIELLFLGLIAIVISGMIFPLQHQQTPNGNSMAKIVQAAFNQFFDTINLNGDYREIANQRRDHLIELLGNKFHVIEAFSSGSIPKFTALQEHADLDIMLVLHYGKHAFGKTPTQVLQTVRDALAYKTTVRKNGQAVTLHYTSWPSVDVVPVYYVHNGDNQVIHYCVPDEHTNSWINSNPKTHAKAIQDKASECGENFRRIIKFAKHWNKGHSDYLQSYHIEVLALKIFTGTLQDITWDTFSFFDQAIPLLGSPIWSEWGYTDDYLSANDRNEVIKRFNTARTVARSAWYHTYNGRSDHAKGIGMWQQIFGEKFPVYG
jgi:hypothetical protein